MVPRHLWHIGINTDKQTMSGGLVAKLELAKQDKRALNALVLEYLPFIRKNVQAVFFDREGRQDALTDAMLAFVHAVQTYNPESGTFASYSAALMRNRVINFAKKEYREKKRFIFFPGKDNETSYTWENDISQHIYDIEQERQNLENELEEVDAVFSRWGFDWDGLAKKCPRQERSRKVCYAIAKKLTGNVLLFESMMKTHQLPVTHLVTNEGVSKKALEKYRWFIAALAILTSGDYPYIRAFLPHYFVETAAADNDGEAQL
jgi:RNA polymerase sigma factor